jgi:lysophospholipase L1-like esterase
LVGIIHVAQYIQFRRPSARVVINGILPKPNPASRKWEGTRYYSAIAWINDKLHCYAQGLENVEYFDASNLFSDENGLIKEDLMPDGVHPSGKGARIWGEAILQRLEQILDQGHTMENDETR